MALPKESNELQNYELWKCSKEGYSFFPEKNESARKLLSPDAALVTVISAKSWDDAQKKKNEYLGYEPYKPMN